MDIVKLEDVNITVKTLIINGKKISKSYFDQIPFGIFMFYTNDTSALYYSENNYDTIGYHEDSTINGKFVAYLRKDIKKSDHIRNILRFHNFQCTTPEDKSEIYYPMLYLDNKGKLRRSYIAENDIHVLKLNDEQIFI